MTKDELENELTGTQKMLEATDKQLTEVSNANLGLQQRIEEVEGKLGDFDFMLKHGLQMDYELKTLSYRAQISLFVVQNHRQTVYVEGRGTIPVETLYSDVGEALQAFYGTNTSLPG